MSLQLLMFCLILCQICTTNDYEGTKQKYRYSNRIKAGNSLVKSHARKSKEVNNCDSNVLQPDPIFRRFMYNFVGDARVKDKQPKPNKRKLKYDYPIYSQETYYVSEDDLLLNLMYSNNEI
ncbi:hypothetical protein CBL_09819 [Carabus blaptoides fortunei]